MTLDVPDETYRAIEEAIANPNSPVGIDAAKTHVMILHKLIRIEERLAEIERVVAKTP